MRNPSPPSEEDAPSIARVVIELGLDREFDYRIPRELRGRIHAGSRVKVPFGRSQRWGFVTGLAGDSSVEGLKDVAEVVGSAPLIGEVPLRMARWMAGYYAAPLEDAVRTVLPAAVRRPGASHRRQLLVSLTAAGESPGVLEGLRTRAPRQAELLEVLRAESPIFMASLCRATGAERSVVQGLARKGFVHIGEEALLRDPLSGQEVLRTQPLALMPQQKDALAAIVQSLDGRTPRVILLHGVTGSGKTEVYLQAIQEVLDRGQGAIVLVPEISLTPQMMETFRGRFGDQIAVLHSHLSDGERHDEWHRLHQGQARIALGARSALFAPVRNPGLIVVDEEHENSYKQEESPRYHARDMAVLRGSMESCAVVLGSATPSMESLQNVRDGKYRRVELAHRVDHRKMPVLRIVDMRNAAEKEGRVNILTQDLKAAIEARLDRAEQVILFLNRRGFSSSVLCPQCGFLAECPHCSVSLTYHKAIDRLVCHLCGESTAVPRDCPQNQCAQPDFRYAGIGTQRVEDVVKRVFPRARVCRMDADTTSGKDAHRKILGDFRSGKLDILVGTQMIAKGLHFPNVTLVGVVFADTVLHLPDFRAGERTFQLLTQVAGRAGRGDLTGEVIVQTFTPHHEAVQAARRMDYTGFADQELEARRELAYPPYTHLVCVTLLGKQERAVLRTADTLAEDLRPRLAESVRFIGPLPSPIARVKDRYRFQILLRDRRTSRITTPLREALAVLKKPQGVSIQVDVDATSLL